MVVRAITKDGLEPIPCLVKILAIFLPKTQNFTSQSCGLLDGKNQIKNFHDKSS